MAKLAKLSGPEFVRFFEPVIDALKKLGGSARPTEVRDTIATTLNIMDQQRSELMPGGASRFENQIAWARFYLAKADYIDSTKRGVWTLTDKGRRVATMNITEALDV